MLNTERNRLKFAHVDDTELLARKEAVVELKERVAAAKAKVNSARAKGKLDSDRRAVRDALALRRLCPLSDLLKELRCLWWWVCCMGAWCDAVNA